MPFEITMPQLGLTMEVGTVVEWLLGEGDSFAGGQEILQVETDKANVAVEAHQDGTLARIVVPAGHEVPVGAVLAVATEPGERLPADWSPSVLSDAAALPDASAPPAPAMQAQATHPDPDQVRPSAPELQASWKARAMARQAGLDLQTVTGSGLGGRIVAADVAQVLAAVQQIDAIPDGAATPVAANLAAALGLDLALVPGTGPGGRIGQADVLASAAGLIRAGAPGSGSQAAPAHGLPLVIGTTPLKGVRKIVSEGMARSAHTVARVTLFREANVSELVRLRQRLKDRGLDISYNDLLIHICAVALREHPEANTRLTPDFRRVEHLDRANIGLAVDTDRGLLVPVVHNAGALSIEQIAVERARLIDEARSGRIHPDDLSGGTFTITNLGMFGVEGFTPVINLPECCILGVGQIVRKPVIVDEDDTLAVRPMMTISLVFDHRVIDGAPAARFLDCIAQLIEDPLLLLVVA